MARVLFTAGAALLVSMLSGSGPNADLHAQGPPIDDRLGTLTEAVADLNARDIDGRVWTVASLRDHVTVIDFWATWCAPCLTEIPTLRRIHAEYTPRAVVLGINLDVTDRRTLLAWMNRQRVNWPQVHDGRGYNGDFPRRVGVTSLPTSIVVDTRGRVVAMNLRGERLMAAVKTLVETP